MANRPIFTLWRDFCFEAAHRLPHVHKSHKCHRLHDHSFRVRVVVRGPNDLKLGWVMDYGDIKRVVSPLIKKHLDHYYLNEVRGLENPTSENLCHWLWRKLIKKLPLLHEIQVAETCETACVYRGESDVLLENPLCPAN